MKVFYVEYIRDDKKLWCTMTAKTENDVKYTVELYGCQVVLISEI